MNSQVVILSALLVCFFGASQVSAGCGALDVLTSTTKIIGRLCYANNGANKNDQALIDDFFGCYDQAPGKDVFVKCQTQVWGGPLDNAATVAASCTNQLKLVPYSNCLRREFKNAGLDMTSTVLTLNACQSAVLGIN